MMQFINKNNIFEKLQNLNKGLIFIVCLIFLCGLLILYSASGANIKPWVIRQFIYFCVFAPVAIIISITNIKTLFKMSYIIYFIGVFLLLLVELIGHKSMGATRWLNLGIIRIQPSEIMKLCLILGLARYFYQLSLNEIRTNLDIQTTNMRKMASSQATMGLVNGIMSGITGATDSYLSFIKATGGQTATGGNNATITK